MYYAMTDYQQVFNDFREVYLTAGKLYPAELAEGYSDIYNISDDSGYADRKSTRLNSSH